MKAAVEPTKTIVLKSVATGVAVGVVGVLVLRYIGEHMWDGVRFFGTSPPAEPLPTTSGDQR